MKKIKLVEQMEHSECGLACVNMILNYYNYSINLSTMREKYGVPIGGFNLLQMSKMLNEYKVDCKGVNINSIDNLEKSNLPLIAFWKNKHFIIIQKIKKRKVLVTDPALGTKWIDTTEFNECFSNKVLFCEPNKNFIENTNNNKFMYFTGLVLSSKYIIIKLILLSLVIQTIGIGVPMITRRIVDYQTMSTEKIDSSFGFIILLFVIGYYIINVLRGYAITKFQTVFDEKLMCDLYSHLLKLPYKFFTNRSHGELVFRMNSNLYIRQILSQRIISVFIDCSLIFAYLFIMFKYSLVLTLIVLLISSFLILISILNGYKIKQISENELIKSSEVQSSLNESILGILTIKSVGGEDNAFKKWHDPFKEQLKYSRLKGNWNAILSNIPHTIQFMLPLFLLWYGSYNLNSNAITIGTLVAFNTIASSFINPILSLSGAYTELLQLKLYLDKLYDIHSTKIETIYDNKYLIQKGKIKIKNVNFKYDEFSSYVLKDINIEVNQGEKVAIVGRSGSGKSTLFNLLIGLYKATSGSFYIDDIDLSSINIQNYRKQLGVVTQSPQVFNGTIKENILFGKKLVTDKDLLYAVEKSDILSMVNNSPLGLDTIISEDGMNFSGGQKQRISMARALVSNPKILLLDEPTSSLDNESENEIMNTIFELKSTCFVISHRLSNMNAFDKIIVIDEGFIVGQGTHNSLVESCETYNDLYNLYSRNAKHRLSEAD